MMFTREDGSPIRPERISATFLRLTTIAITLDTYSHVTPEMDREAANRVAEAIFGPVAEPSFGPPVGNPFAIGLAEPLDAPSEEAEGEAPGEGGKAL